MKIAEKIQILLKKFYFFLLTQLLVLFSTILILPFLFLLLLYRKTISILVPFFDETVVKITSGLTAIIACESEELSTAPAGNSLSCMIYSGVINLEQYVKDFDAKVVNLSLEGNLIFPEFRQYFKRILGYTFYKWESSFDIQEHIREYNATKIINEDTIGEVADELVRQPFKDERSPWELVFLYKYKHSEDISNIPKTVVFMRYSHALADAYSMSAAFDRNFLQPKEVETKTPRKTWGNAENFYVSLIKALLFIFGGGFFYTLSSWKDEFGNGWLIERPNRKIHRVRVNPVPVERIKIIMKTHQIGYTPALLAAITGGIRSYMVEKNMKIPPVIHMTLPVLLPNRKTNNLTNHVSATIAELPIGVPDPVDRMRNIQENFLKTINHPISKIFPLLTMLTGCLPSAIVMKISTAKKRTSLLGSLAPGPTSTLWYKDHELTTVGAAGGFGRDNNGFALACLTYNKLCNISVGLDTAVVKEYSDAKKVIQKIRAEFDTLGKSTDLV